MATPESESFVRTFARGLQVIEAMGQSAPRTTIAQIAQSCALPRTVVRRLLLTLAELGFVQTDEKSYWLTPKVLRLGMSYLQALPFWRHSQLILEELSHQTGQSCAISVLDGHEIVYVHRFHTRRILAVTPLIGARLPAYAVSMGRVLLGSLPAAQLNAMLKAWPPRAYTPRTLSQPRALMAAIAQARAQGHAWVDGELDESICGIAVPVLDAEGRTIAAVNVSLLSGQATEAQALKEHLPRLKLAASRLRAASLVPEGASRA